MAKHEKRRKTGAAGTFPHSNPGRIRIPHKNFTEPASSLQTRRKSLSDKGIDLQMPPRVNDDFRPVIAGAISCADAAFGFANPPLDNSKAPDTDFLRKSLRVVSAAKQRNESG